MAVFGSQKSPTLISRKIWVIEKFWNFHTVTTTQLQNDADKLLKVCRKSHNNFTKKSWDILAKKGNMGLISNELSSESLTRIPWKRKNRKVMRGLTELPTQIFLNTDLGSLIGIFLPLHFHLKSILADFRRSKSAILSNLEALNFDSFVKSEWQEILKFPHYICKTNFSVLFWDVFRGRTFRNRI